MATSLNRYIRLNASKKNATDITVMYYATSLHSLIRDTHRDSASSLCFCPYSSSLA